MTAAKKVQPQLRISHQQHMCFWRAAPNVLPSDEGAFSMAIPQAFRWSNSPPDVILPSFSKPHCGPRAREMRAPRFHPVSRCDLGAKSKMHRWHQ